jgi:hypothetical protein
MKVVIKSENKKFAIILPTALILNRLTATIATKIIKSKWPSIDISTKDFMELINSIKNYKKSNKYWELLNISSADGEIVYISL